ncbi:MAG: ankyrin repeat domain-containing protein, partial [Myxococcales bacterium]|nr:ankyrin repeat domain-containing protein [Myxococcales bacterium]
MSSKLIYFLYFFTANFLFSSDFSYQNLIKMIKDNETEKIENLLNNKDINTEKIKGIFAKRDKSGNTPILYAASKNRLNLVDLFLKNEEKTGININEQNNNKDSLLHILCRSNACKIAKDNNNINLNNSQDNIFEISDSEDESFLDLLTGQKRKHNVLNLENLVNKILKHQHIISQKIENSQEETPYSLAISSHNEKLFEVLYNKKPDNEQKIDLLKKAVEESNLEAFNLLVNDEIIKKILEKDRSSKSELSKELIMLIIQNSNKEQKNNNNKKILKKIINEHGINFNTKLSFLETIKNYNNSKLVREIIYNSSFNDFKTIKNNPSILIKSHQKYTENLKILLELSIILDKYKDSEVILNQFIKADSPKN